VSDDSPYAEEKKAAAPVKKAPAANPAGANRQAAMAGPQKTAGGVPVKQANKALPAKPAAQQEEWAKASDDFTPSDARELGFKAGDYIRVLAKDPNGWWSGELNGKLGFVPSTYLEPCAKPARTDSAYKKAVPAKKGR